MICTIIVMSAGASSGGFEFDQRQAISVGESRTPAALSSHQPQKE
jgi:hypothetical protein